MTCRHVTLSGRTYVQKVLDTGNVLAYHHTPSYYPVHIVTIPKKHISSLLILEHSDKGRYQDSKHLHFHVFYGEPIR
nr:hypothetical protein [Paenibacillus sedimenti]